MWKLVIKEIIVILISALVTWLIWNPVNSQIDFTYRNFTYIQTFLLIQYFRWFVFYDHVIIFQRTWSKFIFFFLNIFLAIVFFTQGMEIIRLLDNFDPSNISKNYDSHPLSPIGSFNLYQYLKPLLTFTTYCLSSAMLLLDGKMLYKTIGVGSSKVRKFIETTAENPT